MKPLRIKHLALILSLFLIACQEDSLVEDPQLEDEDLLAATRLSEKYFKEKGGRISNTEVSITVLKYIDGQIYFNTNTDDIEGYTVVNETTITAYVEPGEFVLWYRGSGLANVEDVDFDDAAKSYLNQQPNEYFDLLWVLQVPSDYNPEHDELKYDIVYESKDNEGVVIRLDPKIKVNGGGSHSDDGSGNDDGSDDDGSNPDEN